jgi:membrane protease YdiL (CAAX protease family)
MMIKKLFWNDSEERLRAGWRILLTWATMLLIFQLLRLAVKPLLPVDWSKSQKLDFYLACLAVIATLVIWKSRIWIDKRTFVSLGLDIKKWAIKDIAAGFIISAILVGIIIAIEVAGGWVTFEFVQQDKTDIVLRLLNLFLLTGFIVAWWENLFFVSYLFLNLKDGCGFWCAFALNCLIFSLVHLSNPNASIASFGGILLIHAYEIFAFLKTGNLWLVLGIHAGWNSLQGLAGFAVSGQTEYQVIAQVNTTPAWLGGGLFGPEAGLIIVLTSIIAFTLIVFYTKLTRVDSKMAMS